MRLYFVAVATLIFLPHNSKGMGISKIAKHTAAVMMETFCIPILFVHGVSAKRMTTANRFRTKTMPIIASPRI